MFVTCTMACTRRLLTCRRSSSRPPPNTAAVSPARHFRYLSEVKSDTIHPSTPELSTSSRPLLFRQRAMSAPWMQFKTFETGSTPLTRDSTYARGRPASLSSAKQSGSWFRRSASMAALRAKMWPPNMCGCRKTSRKSGGIPAPAPARGRTISPVTTEEKVFTRETTRRRPLTRITLG